VVCEFLGDGAI